MTKEKLESLRNYITSLKHKLHDAVPPKHEKHPHTYKEFLNNEINKTKAKIEQATIEGVK